MLLLAFTDAMESTLKARLDAAKAGNTLERLVRCACLINERALARTRTQVGWPALRQAHLALFAHIDLAGCRVTDIATRMGVSKQAVAPLVDELVAHGALRKVPDPSDGRARLVRLVEEGPRSVFAGLQVLADYEADLGVQMGAADLSALRQGLSALARVLGEGG